MSARTARRAVVAVVTSVVLASAVIAVGTLTGFAAATSEGEPCELTSQITDPDTGDVYTLPVNNPVNCPADQGAADPFVPVEQPDGSWRYRRPATVEPGFAAVPERVTSCSAIIVYSVRGTRENFNTDRTVDSQPRFWSIHGLKIDRGLGMVGQAVYENLRSIEPAGTVTAYSAYYPAAPTSFGLSLANAGTAAQLYLASVRYGVEEALNDVNQLRAQCPESRLVLVGYSQGVDVLRHVLADPRLSSTVASPTVLVQFFGDPNFDPAEQNQAGSPDFDPGRPVALLNGAFDATRTGLGHLLAPVIPRPPAVPARFTIVSWCHHLDVVCQGEGGNDTHSSYGAQDGAAAANVAAHFFATTTASGLPSLTPAVTTPVAFPLVTRCVDGLIRTTEVTIGLDKAGPDQPVTINGTVGFAEGGIPRLVAPIFQAVADAGTAWRQSLPIAVGQSRFLYRVTQAGVPNLAGRSPDGGHPDVTIFAGFFRPVC